MEAQDETNVPGPFRVNTECIWCGVCPDLAPGHFRTKADSGESVVYRQPTTPEEWSRCRDAMDSCAVEAIECAPIEAS